MGKTKMTHLVWYDRWAKENLWWDFFLKRILLWNSSAGGGTNVPNKTSLRAAVEESTKMSSDLQLFLSNVNVSVGQTMEMNKVSPIENTVASLTMCHRLKWTFGITSDYFLSREANLRQTKWAPKLTSSRAVRVSRFNRTLLVLDDTLLCFIGKWHDPCTTLLTFKSNNLFD